MNLLLINYEYPPIGGGAATATWNISRELVKQGHQVWVVTSSYQNLRGWSEKEGVKIYRCWALRKSPERSNLLEQLSFSYFGYHSRRWFSKNNVTRIR